MPTEELIITYKEDNLDYQATQVIKTYSQVIAIGVSSTFWYCQNDWCDVNDSIGEGRFGLMYCENPSSYLYKFKPSGYAILYVQ